MMMIEVISNFILILSVALILLCMWINSTPFIVLLFIWFCVIVELGLCGIVVYDAFKEVE